MPQRRALIIGGSLGGLIAAHLLRSVGWDAVTDCVKAIVCMLYNGAWALGSELGAQLPTF